MTVFEKSRINALLPLWNYKIKSNCYNYIERKVIFPSFSKAWQFMNDIREQNEKMNHHCKYVNNYTKVKIKIYTHTTKDVTDKDVQLAIIIDSTLKQYDHKIMKK
ncbi:pterin-4a-carbinolamine dehydratase, putative [Plasmodium malariae]|uniref:4a-hydroxytetrahydrobiopterin dehydratase n=1 Tax=Plasmodium malariae TaxID=5858 RepID=A0A1C3KCC3_PLAMA|nr:pterin-4a-carbinolamine dehydratase, putative [Plasmodium malariae]SBT71191.1 pterin-4a-carbinolamine dehydratase, putative [Plasmodium malariae]SCN12611.1 pterin-4a-carbinolamine dehydratase, putative [Plasmodium malariae]